MAPPKNKALTEVPGTNEANKIKVILGGIIGPKPPPAAIAAHENG